MKIYVASSWRNTYQPRVVEILREAGHQVYDFRHPPGGDHLGFKWSDVDPSWQDWDTPGFLRGLEHPIARAGFDSDFGAMTDADLCVLVLPCGRSAHLEAGFFAAGCGLIVYIPERIEPELMYLMADQVVTTEPDLITAVSAFDEIVTAVFDRLAIEARR